MARFFWYFILYSVLGFVLEVVFARATRQPKRDRKCHYLLPLCPVYGVGMLLVLSLPTPVQSRPLLLLPCAGIVASAAEYGMALFYERVMKVSFWDYSGLPFHLHGRVCLLFSFFWGILSLLTLYGIHPVLTALVETIPTSWTVPAVLLFGLDLGFTLWVLRRTRSTESLRWYLRPAVKRASK